MNARGIFDVTLIICAAVAVAVAEHNLWWGMGTACALFVLAPGRFSE